MNGFFILNPLITCVSNLDEVHGGVVIYTYMVELLVINAYKTTRICTIQLKTHTCRINQKLDRCSISTKFFLKKKISIRVLIRIHEMKIMLCALVVMKEVRKNCTTFKEV